MGRRKGGQTSQRLFETDPEHARRVGFKIRTVIRKPHHSALLAEFVGVVLGDGCMTDRQLTVYFNANGERGLARHCQRSLRRLFGLSSTLRVRPRHVIVLVASGKNFIEFLHRIGLKSGNKMKNKVRVPAWIFGNHEFMKGCLRGLMDTDGGIFFHRHAVRGLRYRHIGICYTSYSQPLLRSAYHLFRRLGLHAKISRYGHVFLYRRVEIQKYMDDVGSRNPRLISRFMSYKSSRI